MRTLILLILTIASSCTSIAQRNSAGVTIPAQQTFVLGEYADYAYSAKLKNEGKETVTAALRDKTNKMVAETISLAPGAKARLDVGATQEVTLANASDRSASVNVAMSRQVTGMRYVNADGSDPNEASVNSGSTAPALSHTLPAAPTASELIEVQDIKQSLEPGQVLLIGEGSSSTYSVEVSRLLGDIKVSVRDRNTGEQTQGFGLGLNATVHIKPNEFITLINEGSKRANVSAKTTEPVIGKRVLPNE